MLTGLGTFAQPVLMHLDHKRKVVRKLWIRLKNLLHKEESVESTIDTSVEHVKELRRLCLEDEAKMREGHSSLAASEESLN